MLREQNHINKKASTEIRFAVDGQGPHKFKMHFSMGTEVNMSKRLFDILVVGSSAICCSG